MSTFYIDKDDGGHEMFRDTREIKNAIAYGKAGVLGKFIEMMVRSLDLQEAGETIVIKTKKRKIMKTPDVIYLQVCGECKDNDCEKCNFDDFAEITWCKDRIYDNDVAYFSEEHVFKTLFASLHKLGVFLGATYGYYISAGTITEDIMRKLKGDNNA